MFSKKLKYALKALIHIANKKEEFAKAQDIAQCQNIPKKYLEQILLELKEAKMINSKQGNKGGYFLVKSSESITLADVYRLINGPIALTLCASKNFYQPCDDCTNEMQCSIKWASIQVRTKIIDEMESINIAILAN